MKKFFTERKFNIIYSASAVVLMWLVWVIAYYSVSNDYLIPSFTDTMASLWGCIKEASFWVAFLNTVTRTVLAFIISFVIAAALAVTSAVFKRIELFLKPIIGFLRTLPTLAVILIFLIWTSPKTAPVIVTVLVLLPMIYSHLFAAISGIDFRLKEMAKVYSISLRDRVFRMYLPLVLPNTLSQTGADISLGLKIMISAEVLANTYKSLGGLMQSARLYVEMPRLAALTLVTIIIGLVIDFVFSQFERITFKWSRKECGHD